MAKPGAAAVLSRPWVADGDVDTMYLGSRSQAWLDRGQGTGPGWETKGVPSFPPLRVAAVACCPKQAPCSRNDAQGWDGSGCRAGR